MKEFDDLFDYVPRIANVLANCGLNGLLQYQAEILQVLALLSDDESKDIFLREMAYWAFEGFLRPDLPQAYYGGFNHRMWDSYWEKTVQLGLKPQIKYPPCNPEAEIYTKAATFLIEQYRYKNKVKVEPGEICLDIGACIGDTSIWMMENGAQDVYAFEIDRGNLEFLTKNVEASPEYENIKIFNLAISDKPQQLCYLPVPNRIGWGKVLPPNEQHPDGYMVECVCIDSFCESHHIRPTFIKMDIEGGEPAALAGAKNIIQKCRPKLALCVYHAWPHRWEIPLTIASWVDDYDYFLKRSHPHAETVLFAIPKH